VLDLQKAGGQVLDTREPADFASAHLAGSINIGLGGQYATWAGTILDHDRPIAIVADPGRENESAVRLGRIGFDHVVGYLKDGLQSLAARPDLTATTERVSPHLAAERMAAGGWTIVDVRAPHEREAKHVAGSLHLPLNQLEQRLDELPKDAPILVYCAGGYRSSIAASVMQHHGYVKVGEVAGGITAWETAKLPVQV
jgi:rhodanese-related sulfurtransferase